MRYDKAFGNTKYSMVIEKNSIFFPLLIFFAASGAHAITVTPIAKMKDPKVDIVRAAFASVLKPDAKDHPIPAPLKRIPHAYFRAASFDASPTDSLEGIAEAVLLARMPAAPRMQWKDVRRVEGTPEKARSLAASLWTSYGYDPADSNESGAFKRLFPRLLEIADPKRGTELLESHFIFDGIPYDSVVIVDVNHSEALALVAGSVPKTTPEPDSK